MASIQVKQGRFYIVERFQSLSDESGLLEWKTKWHSTDAQSHREAEKALKQFENARPKRRLGVESLMVSDLLSRFAKEESAQLKSWGKAYFYTCRILDTRFGRFHVSALDRRVLKDWIGELRQQGCRDSTIHKYFKCFSRIVNWSITEGLFQGPNPLNSVKVEGEGKARGVIYSPPQQRQILDGCLSGLFPKEDQDWDGHSMPGQLLHDLIFCSVTHGLRKGELIGVNRPTAKRHEAGRVLRAKSKGSAEPRGRRVYEKVLGLRVKDFNPETLDLWFDRTKVKMKNRGKAVRRTHIKVIKEVGEILARRSAGKAPDDLIFTYPDGRPIFDIQEAWGKLMAHLKLELRDEEGTPVERGQFRDLRTTAAANMLSYGLGEMVVARTLGHVDLSMVSKVYLRHLHEAQRQEAAEKIEKGIEVRDAGASYRSSSAQGNLVNFRVRTAPWSPKLAQG